DNTRSAKMAKDPWSSDEVALPEPLRILHEPIEPFGSDAAHPYGRASLDTGHEVERGAEAQRQAAGTVARHQLMGNSLLLRRSHGEEAEAERARFLNELEAVAHGRWIIDEAHGRIVMA